MAESLIQSVIKCPICLEAYCDPRMLPCLHSFCQKCLNSYIENCRMGPNQNFFTCPVCREEIYPPHPYRPLSHWSTQFRSNFIMTDLASCLTEVSKGKEEGNSKGEVCFPCSKQLPFPKEAEHFCLDCSHSYCEACMQVHMSIPSCQKHSIVPIDDFFSREQHQRQHRHCAEHPEEILKMFCEDCSKLLCPICALMEHRQCRKLNSVTPMAAAKRLHLDTSQRSLVSTLGKAKEKQAKLKEEKEVLSNNISTSLREMDEAYDSLITKIKERKRTEMLKVHEAISDTQKHLVNCEEQIGVFIAVLEENMAKIQSKQLISSDIQLLQEVNRSELKETENDVLAANAFLKKLDSSHFDIPGIAKEKLEEIRKILQEVSLTTCQVRTPQEAGKSYAIASEASKPAAPEHTPPKLSAVGSSISHGHPCFALQLQQERLACRSVLSTSSDISAASTSSSEGSLACGNSSDGQRNPFSFVSTGKRSVRRPTARPRNSMVRKALSGGSVFSVKHPVVTAANSTVKQASPKKSGSGQGFVFVPAKNVTALFSQFKPIPKLVASDAATDAALLDVLPSTSAMSGSHTLPKPTLPKSPAAGADLMLPSSRGTNTTPHYSGGQAANSVRTAMKTWKSTEQARKTSSTSLSVVSSATMTSPKVMSGVSQEGANTAAVEMMDPGEDGPAALEGATGFADDLVAVGGTEAAAKASPGGETLQRPEGQKLRTIFKICPASAGDLRRPIISDFAVLPSGRLAVVDRANGRLKVVVLRRQGQDGLCPCLELTKPHGCCHVGGDTVAVVSHVAKTLQLVSVATPSSSSSPPRGDGEGPVVLSLAHTHNTCRGYLSVARLGPGVLAARFSLGVHVLDVSGPALRLRAAIVNNKSGKPLFQSPSSMCTTPDAKIVVLDSGSKELSCWDQTGAALWSVLHSTLPNPRSVCSVGLRRLYVISSAMKLDCLNAASGKMLHSVKLEGSAASEEVSTMAQDGKDRILVSNLEEILCFDWV